MISITCALQGTSEVHQNPDVQGIRKNMDKVSLYNRFYELQEKQVAKY